MDVLAKPFSDEQKADLLKKIQSDLPPGWTVHFAKKHVNRVFFFNKKDGTRTWKHPEPKSGTVTQKTSSSRKRKSDELKNKSPGQTRSTSEKPQTKITQQDSRQKSNFTINLPPLTEPPKKTFPPTETPTKKRQRPKKKRSKSSGSKMGGSTASNSSNSLDAKTVIPVIQDVIRILNSGANHNMPEEVSQKKSPAAAKVPSPITIEDIEMIELDETPPKKQCISHEEKNVIGESGSEDYYCIIDTNVLLRQNALDFIDTVIENRKKGLDSSNLTFIIPWVVLQELDHLKKSKQQARSAISFLNEKFKANHSIIRGQSILEAAAVIDGFTVENNDDRILQCCFTMTQESADARIPILITQDKNLANKSLANGIKCFNEITDVQKIIGKMAPKSNSKISQTSSKIHENVKKTAKQSLDINRNPILSPACVKVHQPITKDELTSLYKKSCDLILTTLSFILEREMKDAFGELWLDIVLRKPPWKMTDILKCVQKHWVAVFKVLGVDHIIEVHATHMLSMEKDCKPDSAEFVKEWVSSGICLIAGINNRVKYREPVRSNLAELQEIQRRLLGTPLKKARGQDVADVETMKDAEDFSSQSFSQDANAVEMTVHVVKSDDFWIALDKIWTSIISHCCMIFQSLSFVPSRISNSPEICQALSATYETVPPRPIALQALPFVKELVESLQTSLERFISLSMDDKNFSSVFMDLLQTLWTTIQAFSVNCDIHSLMSSHQEICIDILSSQEMIQRLKVGLHQLEVAKELLGECLLAVLT